MESTSPRVVILGAGLAGMSAAWALQKTGADVILLEAQNRSGGRVLTLRTPFADGMYAEAGPISIPDSESTVMRYIAEFDLAVQNKRPPNAFHKYFLDGRLIDSNDPDAHWPGLPPAEQKLGPNGLFTQYIMPAITKMGNVNAPGWPPPELRPLDEISAAGYVRRQGASDGAVKLLGMGLFDEDGDGFEETSALFAFAWLSLILPVTYVYTLVGGTESLALAFADRLSRRIHYGCEVTNLRQTDSGVSIEYRKFGAGLASLEADFAICTIPFPVLANIPFEPELPPVKQKMLDELKNTSVLRTYIQTRARFWAEAGFDGQVYTELPVMNLYSGYDGPGERGILESYVAGAAARARARQGHEHNLNSCLHGMTDVYPVMADQAEGGTQKDWDADPWELGAYLCYAPGQFVEFYPHVATPHGRIHFAGDHTSLLPGWMEGALLSGERAASEVANRFPEDSRKG